MAERTRRATDAVEAHHAFLDASRDGTIKARIEGNLLDPTQDPNDPRHGMSGMYPGGSFQSFLHGVANRAQTYTATTELFEEILLTAEMIAEEDLDWLPLQPHHVPTPDGFILFPRGVENPTHRDYGVTVERRRMGPHATVSHYSDRGAGDRAMIDGFLWTTEVQVSDDGHAGRPVDGVTILPITRWRGRIDDRPFRTYKPLWARDTQMPAVVAGDMTAWAYDEEGATSWLNPPMDQWSSHSEVASAAELERLLLDNRFWLRSLVWATWRWLSEEVPYVENALRAQSRVFRRARPLHELHRGPEDGDVLVFDLRRVAQGERPGGEPGDPPWWRTRWTVRRHKAWRRYAIRDEHGNAVGPTRGPDAVEGVTYVRRQVTIEPYEKGPEWAPLVLREKVGVLSR